MEITLEKIELVKDRTGVTYKEAKEALEAAEGNVVDAIVAIEETVNEGAGAKLGAKGESLKAKIKEILDKGNISRITVSKDGETLLNIPLTVGLLGTVIAPTAVTVGVVASFGFKCKIEFITTDGAVINLTEKAGEFYEEAKEKAPGVYEDIKEKSSEAFAKAKDVAEDVKARIKKEAEDFDFLDAIDDLEDDAEDAAEEIVEGVEDVVEDIIDDIKE
ncbi:MAG: DUF4342 domain-containing protein [Eubacteriaceae bacterium]|nr:DUF4342 domain-containing protein [Eubacteriaceae bacterium]